MPNVVCALPCPVCGDIAAEREDGVWQEDEELDCPCCAARLVVRMDADGTDVWLAEVEE